MTKAKYLFYLISILFIYKNGFTQTPKTNAELDSLLLVLNKATNTKTKAVAMLQLCRYYEEPSTSNLDSLYKYSKKVYTLSQSDKDLQKSNVLAISHLAYRAIVLQQKDSARYFIDTFKKRSEKLDFGAGLTYVHHRESFYSQYIDNNTNLSIYHLENAYKVANEYKVASPIIFKVGLDLSNSYLSNEFGANLASKILSEIIDLIEEPNISKRDKGIFYIYAGDTYKIEERYENALINYQKAKNYASQINDKDLFILSIENIGVIYHYLNEPAKTIALQKQIIASQNGIADIRNNLALAYSYLDLKDYENAKAYYNKVLAQYKVVNNYRMIGSCLKELGFINLKQNNKAKAHLIFDEALKYYETGLESRKKENDENLLSHFKNIFRIYEAKKDFKKSLEWYIKYAEYKNSITKLQSLKTTERFDFFRKATEKDNQIANLEVENKLQNLKVAKEKSYRLSLVIFSSSILLVLVILFNRYRLKQKALKTIAAKNEENKILMREIHHRVKNNLQIILSLLGAQINTNEDDKKLINILTESQNKIKSMALIHQNLYNGNQFSKVEVSSYIKDLVANIQKSFAHGKHEIQFNFDLVKKDIQIDLAAPLGLIVNELVTNAYKYAFVNEDDTKTIKIDFKSINNSSKYQLCVADNGKGLPLDFDVDNLNSYGLQLVHGLVSQLHGEVTIAQDKGTSFNIVLEEPKET